MWIDIAQLRPRLDFKTMDFGRPQSVKEPKSDVAITTTGGDPNQTSGLVPGVPASYRSAPIAKLGFDPLSGA